MNLSNEEDFEAEKSVLSAETNIVGESGSDEEMEDQPHETGLANGAEKMSQLNEDESVEKSVLSAETNIVVENGFGIEVEDEPQETERLVNGAEKMSQFMNEEDFENKSHTEENDSSPETNIVGESALDMEIEDQSQETGLATSGNAPQEMNLRTMTS